MFQAAGRHQCSYLINLQKSEFLHQGGNQAWLQGLKSIPNKLQNLYEINKILAHRPWLLNKSHIEVNNFTSENKWHEKIKISNTFIPLFTLQRLTKGADNWSLAEVVHAIVLLAHFHSLSSFVFACGINEELDNPQAQNCKENIQDNGNLVEKAKITNKGSPEKNGNLEILSFKNFYFFSSYNSYLINFYF